MNKNKKLAAAFTLIVTAAATMAGAYALGNFITNDSSGYVDLSEVDENKTAKATEEEQDSQMQTAKAEETDIEFGLDNVMDATDEYIEEDMSTAETESDVSTEVAKATEKSADGTQVAVNTSETAADESIAENQQSTGTEENSQETGKDRTAGDETAQVMSSSAVNETTSTNLSFSAEEKLLWPVEGNVIMNYSMDKTVYFATLDQYKYNPALIIGCEAGNSVKAAADGKVVSIENLDETGTTMTVDLGDGYQAIYGQLKDVTLKAGDTCKAGDVLGSVNEPSRYYLKEGSNLYFEIEKEGSAINPLDYLN